MRGICEVNDARSVAETPSRRRRRATGSQKWRSVRTHLRSTGDVLKFELKGSPETRKAPKKHSTTARRAPRSPRRLLKAFRPAARQPHIFGLTGNWLLRRPEHGQRVAARDADADGPRHDAARRQAVEGGVRRDTRKTSATRAGRVDAAAAAAAPECRRRRGARFRSRRRRCRDRGRRRRGDVVPPRHTIRRRPKLNYTYALTPRRRQGLPSKPSASFQYKVHPTRGPNQTVWPASPRPQLCNR